MSDHDDMPGNQQQANSAQNLLFLLRTLARQAQARVFAGKSSLGSPTTDEQVKDNVSRSETEM
jgi:hypothetical protein